MRTTELFHSSFSPSSAQLSTEKLAKAIPHPLPPEKQAKIWIISHVQNCPAQKPGL